MARPYKGIIISLESFTGSIESVVKQYIANNHTARYYTCYQNLYDKYMYWLIHKLLEDRFLLQVLPYPEFLDQLVTVDLHPFFGTIQERVPQYETLFSQCFTQLIRLEDLPDFVYLDKMGDSIVVTWKN